LLSKMDKFYLLASFAPIYAKAMMGKESSGGRPAFTTFRTLAPKLQRRRAGEAAKIGENLNSPKGLQPYNKLKIR
jgi:hypothetical protein